MDVESDRSNSTLKIQYLVPAAGTDSLVVQQSHFFFLHNNVWNWTVAEADSHPVCSETSLRSVIQENAKQGKPFEFAHIQIKVSSPAPETFSVREVFEEISHLFEDTPSFGMTINENRYMVMPLVTWATSHYASQSQKSSTTLVYMPRELGDLVAKPVYFNLLKKDSNLQLDQWDEVEVLYLCGNDLVAAHVSRGTPQKCVDSRSSDGELRRIPPTVDQAWNFIQATSQSIKFTDSSTSDTWGNLMFTPEGRQLLEL
jgi:hypothetical protein